MLWIFVIAGLVATVSGLYGLTIAVQTRRLSWTASGAVLALAAVAWIAGHSTVIGWAALVAAWVAGGLVVLASRRARPQCNTDQPQLPATEQATCEQLAASTPAGPIVAGYAAESPTQAPMPLRSVPESAKAFTTVALLRCRWEPAAGVFQASLRRVGQRNAELIGGTDAVKGICLRSGGIRLEIESIASLVPQAQVDSAVLHSWDWPQAAEAAAAHGAHVRLTSLAGADAPRAETVALHRRAHAALAEFAAVVGVWWPDAGKLSPPPAGTDVSAEAVSAASAIAACLCFRAFPPEEGGPEGFVSDTVGLYAFGLPDIQIITDAEPDERVSTALYRLAERFFASGCTIHEEETVDLGELGIWRAHHRRACFAPDRDVVELTLAPPSTVAGPPPPT